MMIYSTFLLFLITSGVSSDYCDSSLCEGMKHVACENSGSFASTCPSDTEAIELSDEIKSKIVRLHNTIRNTVASGIEGFLPASRMLSMTWDSELADLALLNVKSCKMMHDQCRATEKYKFAGQNLCQRVKHKKFEDIQTAIESCIKKWYKERLQTTQEDLNTCCNSNFGQVIGHYTAMVNERQKQVGCGVTKFSKKGYHTFLIACNYAFANMIKLPVYTAGEVASGCTTGVNPDHNALCSVDEDYDINKIF